MQFTASTGDVVYENMIHDELSTTVINLKQDSFSSIFPWEKEVLEWYLNKTIEDRIIQLHKDITKDEIEQLEQLLAYLEL